jgi:chitodextrinase
MMSQSQTGVSLSWGASRDDDYAHSLTYLVGDGTTTHSTNYSMLTISGLATNHVYDFTMQAKDAAGNLSGVVHASAFLESTPPNAPGAPEQVAVVDGSPELSWPVGIDNSGVVTRYKLLADGISLRIIKAPTHTVNLVDFVDCGGLLRGTSYSFTVQAIDPSGNISAPSPALWPPRRSPPIVQLCAASDRTGLHDRGVRSRSWALGRPARRPPPRPGRSRRRRAGSRPCPGRS